jgi:hypothetical protein
MLYHAASISGAAFAGTELTAQPHGGAGVESQCRFPIWA